VVPPDEADVSATDAFESVAAVIRPKSPSNARRSRLIKIFNWKPVRFNKTAHVEYLLLLDPHVQSPVNASTPTLSPHP
jgi:hypothetical protein